MTHEPLPEPALDHDHYMELALVQAKLARDRGEVPVGAVLVAPDGSVLAEAHNAPITSCDPTAHAEILALRRGAAILRNYRLPGTILYATLEPCTMCMGALLHARVRLLVYGAPDPKSGAAGGVVDLTKVAAFNHHVKVLRGVRETECARILRWFFEERRRS